MSFQRLLSWMRRKGHGSTLPVDEPGVIISKRLKELLPAKSRETVEIAFGERRNENDESGMEPKKFGT